jgi:hypothetical protein
MVVLQQIFKRAADGEDVAGTRNGLRMRMEAMRISGAGTQGDDPVWKIFAAGFDSQSTERMGDIVELSKDSFGPKEFLKEAPEELRKPLRPVFSRGFVPEKDEVMTISEFGERFGGEINHLNTKGEGISYDNIKKTKLYDKKRAGFYLDFGEEIGVNISQKRDAKTFKEGRSRYMWIDSGEDFFRSVKGAGQETVRIGADSIQSHILEMVTHSSGTDDTSDMMLKAAAQKAMKLQMSIGKKEGALETNKLFFEAPVSSKPRLISTFGDEDTIGKPIHKKGKINADQFDVYVDRNTLKEMFTNKESRFLSKEYNEALKFLNAVDENKVLKGNFIYGTAVPTPVHGGGHLPIVRIKLDDKMLSSSSPVARVSDFLARIIERDFDKDVISLAAFFGKKTEAYAIKAFGGKSMQDALGKGFDKQLTGRYDAAMTEADEAVKNWLDFFSKPMEKLSAEARIAEYTKFHSFGSMPPLAWTPFYSPFEFGQTVTGAGNAEDVAKSLNEISSKGSKTISAADVTEFREGMTVGDMSYRRTMGEATLMQHNVAQVVLTKGSVLMEDVSKWHAKLDIIQTQARTAVEAGETISLEGMIKASSAASAELGTAMASIGKLKGYTGLFANAATAEAKGKIFGDLMGVLMGGHLYAKSKFLQENGRFLPLTRLGTSHVEGGYDAHSLASIAKVENMIGRDDFITKEVLEELEKAGFDTQGGLADINNASKADDTASALKKGGGFLTENIKGIAMIGGGLIAARALYGALSSGPEPPRLPISNMAPAPLPPEPMVSRQQAGPSIPMPSHSVRASNMNGMTSSRSNTSRMSSVNIQGPSSSFNMGAIGSNWSRTTVRDERSFTSGWEHQRLAEQNGKSDFVHKYMDL